MLLERIWKTLTLQHWTDGDWAYGGGLFLMFIMFCLVVAVFGKGRP